MRCLLLVIPIILLCQCGAPQPPTCSSLPIGSRVSTKEVMKSARSNWNTLANPRLKQDWPTAQKAYNEAVAILFDKIRCGSGDWTERAQKIGTSIAPSSPEEQDLTQTDALFPAKSVKINRTDRYQATPGIGVPVVSWKATSPIGIERGEYLPPTGEPRTITAFLDFNKTTPQWHFPLRWLKEDALVGNTRHGLAADWTAPIDFFWYMCDLDDLRIRNALLPSRLTKETGLYFIQPYDPAKIPLVMVHGLASSPDIYREIINDLAPEPWFRERYQIWLYNYPTGIPWLYNSMKFRQLMGEAGNYARARGDDTNLKKMVILTHSMGGLLARPAVTDPGTAMYDAHFSRPLDQLNVRSETKSLIREGMLYEPLTDVKRMVFMAVPHRGSPMASLRGTRFLSNLIRLPKTLTVELLDVAVNAVNDGIDSATSGENIPKPTSISTLNPNSRSFQGLAAMPLPKNITFHSIMGDKGHGDKENSSDGVVPYWSSHVEPVASERMVPSNHTVPFDPQASDEIRRILLLHLKEEGYGISN
ncbi:MAG: esterase/lipase family protein [Luteolibacter sp.]